MKHSLLAFEKIPRQQKYQICKECWNNIKIFSITQNWKFLLWIGSKRVVINMVEENEIQEFRLENIEETTNYFLKEVNQIELISRKH